MGSALTAGTVCHQAAEFSVTENERTLANSERQRRRTENLLSRAGQQFNQSQDSNQRLIDEVTQKLRDFERDIPGINDQVWWPAITPSCPLYHLPP